MATIDKAFRVKNGLVVEGSTATVNGSNVLTEASTEFLQDTTAGMFDGSHAGISFSYNDTSGKLTASVDANPSFTTSITFEGATADSFETILQVTDPTEDRTITLPNITGTVITSGDTGSVTNTMLAGSIANDKLSNSAITINGTSTSLGGSRTLGTDDVAEGSTNKYFTDERAQDAVGNALGNGLSYDDATGAVSVNTSTIQARVADVSDTEIGYLNGVTSAIQTQLDAKFATANASTTNISEGTNLYFTDERAQDAIGNVIGNGLDYDDTSGAISVDPSEFALSAVGAPTGSVTMATYKITSLGTPTDATDAATKAYVDSVTEGLHIHEATVAATTTNVNLANALENGDVLDGITLATGNRILVKNQTTQSENGIYVVQASGQPVRATDFDTATEVDSGDFVFVYSGTANASTGWVQTNKPATIGTDAIVFTQFSGAGTYLAGNGLTLTGNSFSINTAVTVDLNTAQTLTNKTLTSPVISTITNGAATLTLPSSSGTIALTSDIPTLDTDDVSEGTTNKYFTQERAEDAAAGLITSATHSGISVTYTDNSTSAGTLAFTNTGVTGITGTSDQITASASTGSVTLSLPQSINTTSSPTFAALSVGSGALTAGSLTLTDALIGTATQALTDGTETVVDSWSATNYSSAKYIVQMKKGTDIEVLEVLVTVNGDNNVYLTEYADIQSNTQIGTTDADFSGGNVRLKVTASNGTTVKVHKTLIEA